MALYPTGSGRYISPAQIRLFIGGIWIDDASSVQWAIQDDKNPKFGYNDRTFRAVAMGRTLVQGQLSIEFKFNGYLRAVIAKFQNKSSDTAGVNDELREDAIVASILNDFDNTLLDNREQVLSNAITKYEPASNVISKVKFILRRRAGWEKVAPLDNAYKMGAPKEPNETKGSWADRMDRTKLQRPGLFSSGFDIMVRYGDPPPREDLSPSTTRLIRDVFIVGEGQVISIDVPDGSRAVREVYNFIAKDVSPGWATNGAA